MALLHCISKLHSYGYSCPLRAIHINHGTRVGQKREEQMVLEYCKSLGVEVQSTMLEGLDPERNFEFEARKLRYQAMRSFARPGEIIALGHHIDDSFEWSILQSLRSSNLEGSLGIPVRNGIIARPFMCVTKAQIRRYVEAHDLPFLEDPTNESLRYERNYIRAQIAQGFAGRYPKYLKHYVRRQNELARRLGKHISLTNQSDFEIFYGQDHAQIVSFEPEFNPSGLEQKIILAMNHVLPNGRGTLSGQIAKIIQAMKNHKSGPLSLAKGVKVYMGHNHLLVCSPKYRVPDREFAEDFALETNRFLFKEFTLDEYKHTLEKLFQTKRVGDVWPLWVVVRQKRFNMESSRTHSLWPKLHKEASVAGQGALIAAIKLFRYWSKPKNRKSRLSLRFLLSL